MITRAPRHRPDLVGDVDGLVALTGDDAEELLPMVTQSRSRRCCSWYAARKSSGS